MRSLGWVGQLAVVSHLSLIRLSCVPVPSCSSASPPRRIKKCDTTVVADQFLYGHQDRMVVTLPDNVYLQKMNLKK